MSKSHYYLDTSGRPIAIREHDGPENNWSGRLIAEIVETVDDRFMVLVNGFQWGTGVPDRSGAYSDTFSSPAEAFTEFESASR
jgi:hypothetical protein